MCISNERSSHCPRYPCQKSAAYIWWSLFSTNWNTDHTQQPCWDAASLLYAANSAGPKTLSQQINCKRREKKRGGKTYILKEICKKSAKEKFTPCLNSNYNKLRKTKPSILGQLRKWEQFLDFKDIKKFIIFVCFEWVCEKVMWFIGEITRCLDFILN